MRLLADENIPRALVTALRTLGHDVTALTELQRGSADAEVARLAGAEGRIVITFDKDFGELAVRHGLGGAAGVVLLRFVPESPEHATHLVLQSLAGIGSIEGRLVVVERERVRLRVLEPRSIDPGSPTGPDS
jgi:predicted nuclease of predicted toxin-antitoxin system